MEARYFQVMYSLTANKKVMKKKISFAVTKSDQVNTANEVLPGTEKKDSLQVAKKLSLILKKRLRLS